MRKVDREGVLLPGGKFCIGDKVLPNRRLGDRTWRVVDFDTPTGLITIAKKSPEGDDIERVVHASKLYLMGR